MANAALNEAAVLAALSKVQEPELHKDLVTLNMIRDVRIVDDQVSFTVVLTTPACPLRSRIENEARAAVAALQGCRGCKKIQLFASRIEPTQSKQRATR